ncbi:hypothetical protein [Pseudomonas jilinensis]|uniref:Uncharacterized protein n=1 Tax=Pseudomonas jilinensis TaxID=2078689 RepID=A0A396S0P3_9PSED|nr:hypothetical protein [Pseudomonas jilinensis]RHW20313.1 hypothetical protein C2846_14740 [Pseudomonas jilinensis]
MSPSAEEAARALREIDAIKERAAGFQDYQAESAQLILWGAANSIGLVATALFEQHLLQIWVPLVLLCLVAGALLARRTNALLPGIGWRYLLILGAILFLIVALHAVFWPLSPEQGAMIAPLFVGVLYFLRGVLLRPRYLVIGGALAGLSLLSFLFAGPWFWWAMAMTWGGTLMLSGVWLGRL